MDAMCRCGSRSHPSYGSLCEDCWCDVVHRPYDYNRVKVPVCFAEVKRVSDLLSKDEPEDEPMARRNFNGTLEVYRHYYKGQFVGPSVTFAITYTKRDRFDKFKDEFAQLYVSGASHKYIADALNMTLSNVKRWRQRLNISARLSPTEMKEKRLEDKIYNEVY